MFKAMLEVNKRDGHLTPETCIPVSVPFRNAFIKLLPPIYTVHQWTENTMKYSYPQVRICCKVAKMRNCEPKHRVKTFVFKIQDFDSEEKLNNFLDNELEETCSICAESEIESEASMESESESESESAPEPAPKIKSKKRQEDDGKKPCSSAKIRRKKH
jgi:hypothetical protein